MTGDHSLLVVQDPISRSCHPAAPPKRHCVAPYSRMYSHLSLTRYPATQPHLLGTNGLRCASVHSHGSDALNCCSSSSSNTCPAIPGAHANKFRVTDIYIFPAPAASVGPLAYSIGASLIPQDYCPQHYQLQHSMIDLLTADSSYTCRNFCCRRHCPTAKP